MGETTDDARTDGGAGNEPAAPEILVQVNGEERGIPAGLTVKGLLERLELVPAMVVVEHNREILDRRRYDEITLSEGDRLELVHFVGGG